METVYRRCAGLDVHKDTVMVCVLSPVGRNEPPRRKQFKTFVGDLIRMRVWLGQLGVTEVALESTGTYWLAVWRQLEGHVAQRVLANPQQVKALAGRKSDPRDAQRVAEFLQDGRLDPSFVPPAEIQQLRDLLRHRVTVVQEHNRLANRVEKLLQSYGLKLSSVASDILGQTGRRILEALAQGQTNAERLSWKAVGSLREKEQELEQALRAGMDEHGRWLLAEHLAALRENEQRRARLEERLEQQLRPHAEAVARLQTIPGVDRLVAWTLLAELGLDMSVFPSDRHCASWAGLSPGLQESAGKHYSHRTKKGNRYLRRILTQAAWAASRCQRGYLRAAFFRIAGRQGRKKALVAVARKILVIAYHLLQRQTCYVELGEDYFDLQNPERTARRLLRRLENIGYAVTVTKPPEAFAAPAPLKKRGRPCKCAERGIECKHRLSKS